MFVIVCKNLNFTLLVCENFAMKLIVCTVCDYCVGTRHHIAINPDVEPNPISLEYLEPDWPFCSDLIDNVILVRPQLGR